MKYNSPLLIILAVCNLLLPQPIFGQWDKLKKKVQEKASEVLAGENEGRVEKLIAKFERGQPISTTFDDAVYEADFLGDFEPNEIEYRPLDIQPKTENGGYRLKSGLYSMNAKSFCLRGYTHGPSKGDGHLYAPLKGKKADFVKSIIEHYAVKPEILQQDVQVLIWAIIAGADMNTLGEQHSKTLNALFSNEELLRLTAKGWAEGYAQKQFDELKGTIIGKTPPKLQELLDADEKIRSMVKGNKSFQEIEKIAIIAGVAPRDMVREVSKGRWSYHPDGFFVRFFPNGYPQTRIDVYVPFQNAVETDANGKAVSMNKEAKQSKEIVFNPSGMVASPANRPSQRVGVSPVPVKPTPLPPEEGGRKVIPFHIPQVAYLPVEGAGVHGSYVIKGYAILEKKNGEEYLDVIVNGRSSASEFGKLYFSGDVKLLINGVEIQSSPVKKDPNKVIALPNDGTIAIGDVSFSLGIWSNKNVSIKINVGYVVTLNEGGTATPIPNRTDEEVKIK